MHLNIACGGSEERHAKSTRGVLLRLYLHVWQQIFCRAKIIALPVMTFLWIFFLPAFVLSDPVLDQVGELIYWRIRIAVNWSSFYLLSAAYVTTILGPFHSTKILFYYLVPSYLFSLFVRFVLDWEFLMEFYNASSVIVTIYLISRVSLPPEAPPELLSQHVHNGFVAKPLMKLIFILCLVYMLVNNLVPIFMRSSTIARAGFRFIALPVVGSVLSSAQLHILESVPHEYRSSVLPGIWISNAFLKVFERLFTNSVFKTGDFTSFAMMTFGACLFEMCVHASFVSRTKGVRRLRKWFLQKSCLNQKTSKQISVMSVDGEQFSSESRFGVSEEWMKWFLLQCVLKDIEIELIMVISVTLCLYFANPITNQDQLQTIPNMGVCIIQLSIQLLFELVSDLFGLYWASEKNNLPLSRRSVEVMDSWYVASVVLLLWQSTQLMYWFLSDAP